MVAAPNLSIAKSVVPVGNVTPGGSLGTLLRVEVRGPYIFAGLRDDAGRLPSAIYSLE